jgi:GntR family transcriptional regulator/MocR family aminotransferase
MFWFELDRTSRMPCIRQIYEHVRLKVLRGELRAGERVPATRRLAADLGVSRTVVLEAFAQLLAEGYLEGREGSGTFVAAGACLEPWPAEPPAPAPSPSDGAAPGGRDLVDFRTGVPALEAIPRQLLGRRLGELCRTAPAAAYDYGRPEGHPELRAALSRYLARTRGVHGHPDAILVTTGAAEGLYLAARLLLGRNRTAVVEDPLHLHFQATLRHCGARLQPLPVDRDGLCTAGLAELPGRPGLVFVTPSHQFPTGGILPVQRRIELLRFAAARDCRIVEDDYESEFHFGGTAVSSLQGMDPDRVVYLGTFSKILSPALRVGYLVLPPDLVPRAREIKYLLDNHTPALDQLLVAGLLESGDLERHVRDMKKLYRHRRRLLLEALARAFGDRCQVAGAATGLHVLARFPGLAFDPERTARLEAAGVRVHPVERHAIRPGRHLDQVILGYGNLTDSRIEEGVRRLARALADGAPS